MSQGRAATPCCSPQVPSQMLPVSRVGGQPFMALPSAARGLRGWADNIQGLSPSPAQGPQPSLGPSLPPAAREDL